MWVWICTPLAVLVCAIVFTVTALRAWAQVQALLRAVSSVMAELQSYRDRIHVAVPGDLNI